MKEDNKTKELELKMKDIETSIKELKAEGKDLFKEIIKFSIKFFIRSLVIWLSVSIVFYGFHIGIQFTYKLALCITAVTYLIELIIDTIISIISFVNIRKCFSDLSKHDNQEENIEESEEDEER